MKYGRDFSDTFSIHQQIKNLELTIRQDIDWILLAIELLNRHLLGDIGLQIHFTTGHSAYRFDELLGSATLG